MTMEIQRLQWRIEELHDLYHAAVYDRGDVDAALAAAEPDAVVVQLPMLTGTGPDHDLRAHLTHDVVAHLPADLTFRRVARTVDQRRLVAETVVGFTHDRELPWLLPGVPPTHRHAEVLTFTTVKARHRSRLGSLTTLIAEHRTLWDLAGLITQLRLDPRWVGAMVTGSVAVGPPAAADQAGR